MKIIVETHKIIFSIARYLNKKDTQKWLYSNNNKKL